MEFNIKGKQVNKKEREYLKSLGMKWCGKCQQALLMEDFTKDQYKCKSCSKISHSRWQEHNENYFKRYREINKQRRAEYNAKWYKKNKSKALETKSKWRARQRKANPEFNIQNSLRCRMHGTIIKGYKSDSTLALLGCSFEDCREHLESLWHKGMNWQNYGLNGWHIDHIIPCSFFDLTKASEQKVCFNWKNLQPLWRTDNSVKSDKFPISIAMAILKYRHNELTL
jgi:hypothetical protein